uniref:EF-hand domain-containing protein n=1 Tax=Parascaris univalens TaxID=6257 RepID=A0A915BVK2_PARUN
KSHWSVVFKSKPRFSHTVRFTSYIMSTRICVLFFVLSTLFNSVECRAIGIRLPDADFPEETPGTYVYIMQTYSLAHLMNVTLH